MQKKAAQRAKMSTNSLARKHFRPRPSSALPATTDVYRQDSPRPKGNGKSAGPRYYTPGRLQDSNAVPYLVPIHTIVRMK
jgi:hypothetical protein